MKLVLIGAGNVANQLGIAFEKSGHTVKQVYSRTQASAKSLAKKLDCPFTTSPNEIIPKADLYLIALRDEAIGKFLKTFRQKNAFVVHTSGSVGLDVFAGYKNYGVIYPVQTFTLHRKIDAKKIPFCIEANNTDSLKKIHRFIKPASKHIHEINSTQRLIINLSAVFANNFANHMFSIAEKLLTQNKMEFEILHPIIRETFTKIEDSSPVDVQTGPARRGDQTVLEKHLRLLKDHPLYSDIYRQVSKSIGEMNGPVL